MHAGRFGNEHVLVFEPGERVLETLARYLAEQHVSAGRFTAIGGFRWVELKYFNTRTKQYEQQVFDEQVEVVSLTGNVALVEGKPYIHAHVVVGDQEYRSHNGHLGEGVVEPTLELFLTQLDGTILRSKNAQTGLQELHPHVEPAP